MSNKPSMADTPDFIKTQYAFAAHIRDPDKQPAPQDIEDRRMNIYRELFYNNVEGFMSNTFPVLHEIMAGQAWHAMIRDYFANHLAHTPLFPEMPREFLKYLQTEREKQPDDPPFMYELAHYEWVELGLSLSDQTPDMSKIDTEGDLLQGRPLLSPLAWPLVYNYDVAHISIDNQPEHPMQQPVYILVYRDSNDQVNFLDINPVTAQLLQLILEDDDLSGQQMLEQIATTLDHPQPQIVINGGLAIMEDLRQRGVITGTKHTPR